LILKPTCITLNKSSAVTIFNPESQEYIQGKLKTLKTIYPSYSNPIWCIFNDFNKFDQFKFNSNEVLQIKLEVSEKMSAKQLDEAIAKLATYEGAIHLDISGNDLTELPASLTRLKDLVSLDISNNNIEIESLEHNAANQATAEASSPQTQFKRKCADLSTAAKKSLF
jgi:Leucine-rich repeat (LRR) protein